MATTSTMSSIFKISYSDNNEIKKIYAFVGSEMNKKFNLTELFENDISNKIFKTIFSNEEMSIIKQNNIPVKFCEERIYSDDTIETIKKKLIIEFDTKISFEDIYLFYKTNEQLDTLSLYKKLTQNDKIQLTRNMLIEFLLNIDNIDISSIPEKDIYNYDDILSLNLDKQNALVNKPMGQRLAVINLISTYVANPFDIGTYDPNLENTDKIVSTLNERLLLNYKNINLNMIFLCLAKDVLNFNVSKGTSQEITTKLYFPFLFKNDITSISLLEENKQELLSKTKKLIDKNFIKKNKNIDLFYDIFYERKSELNVISSGIKSIQFIIHPKYSVKLPIDTIFKQIHSTESIPMIKFNPSSRQEKIYRLYSNKTSINGKKIPFLNKSTVFKLIKQIGKNTGISLFINKLYNGEMINVECEIDVNGDISVKSTFKNILNISEITELIKEIINPLISSIVKVLEQSDNSLISFNHFDDTNVEIIDINFQTTIGIKNKILLKKYIGCLSSIFAVYESDLDKGIEMRYKRVAQYNEVDSQTALVIELINKAHDSNEIISELKENFNLTDEEASTKLTSILSEIESQLKVYKNKRIKVDTNPGFLTKISLEKFSSNVIINVFGINDLQYLYPLNIYINSLIRLSQDPSSTDIPLEDIKQICKGKGVSDEKKIEDIVVVAQQALPYQQAEAIAFDVEPIEVSVMEETTVQAPKANILDLFYDEEEEEEENQMEGGAPSSADDEDEENPEIPQATLQETNINIDLGKRAQNELVTTPINEGPEITGMTLNKPNPFFRKLENYEPTLFLTNVDKEFKAYSRACPYNNRRQPVLLTDEEKEKIDNEHPGSYTEAVKYGTNPDKKYWYICPRYWDLKRNVSLTEKEAKSGKYGGIIPFKANKIPPGSNIYEFTDEKYHKDKEDKYINLHPGFLKDKVHPEGLCVPCCFKNWDAPEQTKRRGQCLRQESGDLEEETKEREIEGEQYIKGPEKVPLEPGRWGYLPIAVQKFLRTDNKKCYISNTNTNLKPNIECLLRHGVELNRNQSFIACLADVFVEESGSSTILTIKQMKQKIIESLDLDLFISLQNGNLVNIFENEHIDVIVENYRKSNVYKQLDMRNEQNVIYIKHIIGAYETFIEYLKDDDILLDHKYLWDLVSIPNQKLFKKGINLIILNLERNDITDNISVMCPSNHYSGEFFNTNKYSLILLKSDNFYEPIYTLEDKVKEWSIKRIFNLKDKSLLPNLRNTLEIIKSSFKDKCGGLNSMPTIYKFKTNIILIELIKFLDKAGYEILHQIINYNNKVIGVLAKNNRNVIGFVPCYPSAIIKTIDIKSMGEDIWNNFQVTIDYLVGLSRDSSKKIPCLPKIKVLEDGLIVGIITETNQFIATTEPEQNTMAIEMPSIESSDYNEADLTIMTKKNKDEERIKYIRYIKIESGFYNSFRNTIRILLGQFRNKTTKMEIEDIIKNKKLLYVNKLKKIIEKIIKISKKYVEFVDYSDEELKGIDEVSSCLLSENCETNSYCKYENELCKIKISKINLINKLDNQEVYFGRIADELVRYSRISKFILHQNASPVYRNIKYNINKDEIIILQSLLTQDYFDDLIYEADNNYIQHNTYDTANPIISVAYSNEIDRLLKGDNVEKRDEVACNIEKTTKVGGKLKIFFPKDTIEIIFGTTPELCSFGVIETIINDNAGEMLVNKIKLKHDLIEEYEKYKDYLYEIVDILVKQGKTFASQVIVGQLNLQDMIMSDNYYATNLDIWILANKYNIPLAFVSGTTLIENNDFLLIANKDGSDKYYFVKSSGVGVLKIPKYRLFVNKVAKISVSNFSSENQDLIRRKETEITLNNFIEQFTEKKIRKPKKGKAKLKLILEEQNEPIKEKPKKVKKKVKLVMVDDE
jgi:hypothetical protein